MPGSAYQHAAANKQYRYHVLQCYLDLLFSQPILAQYAVNATSLVHAIKSLRDLLLQHLKKRAKPMTSLMTVSLSVRQSQRRLKIKMRLVMMSFKVCFKTMRPQQAQSQIQLTQTGTCATGVLLSHQMLWPGKRWQSWVLQLRSVCAKSTVILMILGRGMGIACSVPPLPARRRDGLPFDSTTQVALLG